jgi:hypothetical protein
MKQQIEINSQTNLILTEILRELKTANDMTISVIESHNKRVDCEQYANNKRLQTESDILHHRKMNEIGAVQ